MTNSFFNTVGGIFSNIFQGRNKNAIIVPPHKIFTGEFPEVVPKEKFYDYYHSWPQIKSSVNSTAKKLLGAGIEITSNDEQATEMLNKWCDIINFKQKIGEFVTDTLITGDGFFEKQFTEPRKTLGGKTLPVLGNIEQIPTKTFWKINRDPHAQVLKYVQLVDGAQNELSPNHIIHWAINNPDNQAFGKSEFHSVASPRRILGKVDPDSGEAINPDRFVPSVLDMQARILHADMEYREKLAKGRIIANFPGMPQPQMDQLKKELNDPSSEKAFWVFNQDIGKEISIEEASISSQRKMEGTNADITKEIDMATQYPSKIATDPGSASFASTQTPMQEFAERISEMQDDLSEMIQDDIFRIKMEEWGFDYDEVQPELKFKPFLKRVDLENLNKIDPERISDQEYRDSLRDIMSLDDSEFEKEKESKKQELEKQQQQDTSAIKKDETQPQDVEKERPVTTTENFPEILRNPKAFEAYITQLVAEKIPTSVTAPGVTNPNSNDPFAPLEKEEPEITDDQVKQLLDEKDDAKKKEKKKKVEGQNTS